MTGRSFAAILVGWGLISAGPLSAAPPAATSTATDPSARNAVANRKAIDALVTAILAALSDKGATPGTHRPATARDLEARLSFALDQAQSSCSASQAAMAQVSLDGGSLPPAARQALRSAGATLSHCQTDAKTAAGTAALADARALVSQGTVLGLSGGSSNYLGTH